LPELEIEIGDAGNVAGGPIEAWDDSEHYRVAADPRKWWEWSSSQPSRLAPKASRLHSKRPAWQMLV
jgi:hypothetical protein